MNDKSAIRVLFSMDCERVCSHDMSAHGIWGPADLRASERAIRRFHEVLSESDWSATFFIVPDLAAAHADLWRGFGFSARRLPEGVPPEQAFLEVPVTAERRPAARADGACDSHKLIVTWSGKHLQKAYKPVGLVELRKQHVSYAWNQEVRWPPRAGLWVAVFRKL